jgi:hypothetical protein
MSYLGTITSMSSGNRGKYGITLYDSRYQYNKYAALQPIMMGCRTNTIPKCDRRHISLSGDIAAQRDNNIIVASRRPPMMIVIRL